MSKSGWACIIALLLIAVALVVAASPNSYLHAVLTGRCFGSDAPRYCYHGFRSRW
jgi:hypothetical protein